IAVILVLAAILLNVIGYVNNKSARSRADGEIHMISTAMESYKADQGTYPKPLIVPGSPHATAGLSATPPVPMTYTETHYQMALYEALTGDGNAAIGGTNLRTGRGSQGKDYLAGIPTSSLFGSGSVLRGIYTPPPMPSDYVT